MSQVKNQYNDRRELIIGTLLRVQQTMGDAHKHIVSNSPDTSITLLDLTNRVAINLEKPKEKKAKKIPRKSKFFIDL